MTNITSTPTTGTPVFRVGTGTGTHEGGKGLALSARRFGRTDVYNVTATGDLRLAMLDLRDCIERLLRQIAKDAETPSTGAPGAVAGIADALTALQLAVQYHKVAPTRADWWRRHYHSLVIQAHHRLWPRTAVPNQFAPAKPTPSNGKDTAPAEIVSINRLRQLRLEAERRRVAAERERQREIAMARLATRTEPNGQLAMAL